MQLACRILRQRREIVMSKFEFHGNMQNTQIIDGNAKGVQIINPGNDNKKNLDEIRKFIKQNCTEEQNHAAESVIEDISKELNNGNLSKRDETSWIEKIKTALSIGAGVTTILQAPWWSTLVEKIHNFFSILIK